MSYDHVEDSSQCPLPRSQGTEESAPALTSPQPPSAQRRTRDGWFEVDRSGLSKMVGTDSKGRLIGELLQNSFDEDVTAVDVTLSAIPNRSAAYLVVEDDSPEGFRNLDHAYCLFAESDKKSDSSKRGRFNFGEKIALAHCISATIESTTGTVEFLTTGERKEFARRRRDRGTKFSAVLRCTRDELQSIDAYVRSILVPAGLRMTYNGDEIEPPEPICVTEASLPTTVADDEGVLRDRVRKTTLEIYPTSRGEPAMIYEMGLPIIATGDKFHVNVLQKVPQPLSRDSVSPAYLRKVRTVVLNATADFIDEADAQSTWVKEATSSVDCSDEAMSRYLDLAFGEKRASFDPNDLEAGHAVQADGGTLIHGRMMNKQQWDNARRANAIVSAGVLHPTPKPYSDDPNAPNAKVVPEAEWTSGMKNVVSYAKYLGEALTGQRPKVMIVKAGYQFAACYGQGELHLNLVALRAEWFSQGANEEVDQLLLHEFAHHYCGDHLDRKYHEAICKLGAKLKALALAQPEKFREFETSDRSLRQLGDMPDPGGYPDQQ